MRKILVFIFSIFLFTTSSANEILNNLSTKISEFSSGLIPGEGVTESKYRNKRKSRTRFYDFGS